MWPDGFPRADFRHHGLPGRLNSESEAKTMSKKFLLILVAVFLLLVLTRCTDQILMMGASDPASVRLYLVNESENLYLSPNPGLCSQGLTAGPHRFLEVRPILAPAEAVSYTTRQIGGAEGVCTGERPDFMVGLCGWSFGSSPDQMTEINVQYGGQIGHQFNCGDTVILRWVDAGPAGGAWSSECLTAPGNMPATMEFQSISLPQGASCSESP
jgi:hypothetical protein